MKLLFFGDIFGRLGREGVKRVLPEWRRKFRPDFIVANAENITHGLGVQENHLLEMEEAGINFFTSGNHIWRQKGVEELLKKRENLLRPANMAEGLAGKGVRLVRAKRKSILIVNLIGQLFMKDCHDNPFRKIDKILKKNRNKIALVDFHAEATSEKRSFGWFVDGRVSAVLGTHTHVPSADDQILPDGTAYITDVGMCGPLHSTIGMDKDSAISQFYYQKKEKLTPITEGPVEVNAVMVDIEPRTGKAREIRRLREIVKL